MKPLAPARLRPLFIATIFLGSFLLFLIQPMVARMILPRFGGSPQVWNSAMLFYQAVLLAGYAYAHAVARWPVRRQLPVHIVLLGLAALTLPVSIAALTPPADNAQPMLFLLQLLALSVGPIFFLVSTQAPLLQSWFSRSSDPRADNPYFLYAASNIGSLLALVAYPFLLEPLLTLKQQSLLWSVLFVLLIALTALSGWQLRNSAPAQRAALPPVAIDWTQRLRWVALAAVPSGLLLSTTTHLTTDIMAMPLLWVIPLALYLVTFILAFSDGAHRIIGWAQKAAPVLLLVLGGYTFLSNGSVAMLMALTNLVLFFVLALALHGQLSRERPAASALTQFYLWVSVGGVVGGLFCALAAPLLFDWTYEHPLLLLAAALLLPGRELVPTLGRLWQRPATRLVLGVAAPVAVLLLSWFAGTQWTGAQENPLTSFALILIAVTGVFSIGHRFAFTAAFAALLLTLGGWQALKISGIEGARYRSFFGVYTIEGRGDLNVRQLMHGTTLHGVQSLSDEFATRPMSYYSPQSGVGAAMRALPTLSGRFAKVGFVGLGVGTLACYAQPGQGWTAFEIDPVVVDIARHPKLFTYLDRCAPDLKVVLGDARLTLAGQPEQSFDLLVIDAFSSDAIPLHLMTREAFEVYARALKPDGVLLVHISNRHLDLEPVVAANAWSMGWSARVRNHQPGELPGIFDARSIWVALAAQDTRLIDMIQASDERVGDWAPLTTRPGFKAWSDDFASILPVLKLRDD